MMVCHCRAVSDRTVLDVVADGATDIEDIIVRCGAGGGRCQGCWPELRRLLASGQHASPGCATMAHHAG